MPVVDLKLGVGMMPIGMTREDVVEAAILADRSGYDLFSTGEGWTYDGTVMLTEVALKTERIRVCSNILSVYGRSAATMAMAAATLQDVADGRYILGLGASTAALAEGFHDQDYSAPYSLLEHHLSHTRALLAGGRAPIEGRGERSLQLGIEPRATPIWAAGMGPRSRRLIGRSADGWLPVLTPPDVLRQQGEEMTADRELDTDLEVAPMIMVVVRDTEDSARRAAAEWFTMYATRMGDFYPRHIRAMGYGDAVDALRDKPNDPDHPAVERLLDQVGVVGTPDTIRARLQPWIGDGIDLPKVAIQPYATREQIMTTIEALAPGG
ncbi:LLM class flavin-dependent oxidoreductase [Nitriliruptoraceae bacterium ZYF776]|nr:LLM class flavin-dependent oxidoreductase [Profundirhabdus halotolerans]